MIMLEQGLGLVCKEHYKHLQVTYLCNVVSQTSGVRAFY